MHNDTGLTKEQKMGLKKKKFMLFRQVPTMYKMKDVAAMFHITKGALTNYLDYNYDELKDELEGHIFRKGHAKILDRVAVEVIAKKRNTPLPDEIMVDAARDKEYVRIVEDFLYGGMALEECGNMSELVLTTDFETLPEVNTQLEIERCELLYKITEMEIENRLLKSHLEGSQLRVKELRNVIRTLTRSNESMIKTVNSLLKNLGIEGLKNQKDIIQELVWDKLPEFFKEKEIADAKDLIADAAKQAEEGVKKIYANTHVIKHKQCNG